MNQNVEKMQIMKQQLRRFGPKKANHPSISEECLACHKAFKEDDFTTLITLGPGNDLGEQEKARQGRTYNAIAVEVHYACATGHEVNRDD